LSKSARGNKPHGSAFIKRVQNFSHKENLWTKNDSLLLAVSGGGDSMALLFFFHKLQKKYNLSLGVAHVNYQLRGNDSDQDALLVKRNAEKLNLPYFELSLKTKGSSEDTLRNIRFQFFKEVALREGFTKVALAHHQDDQAETLLLRLIRGAGSLGLQGMTPARGLFIRPFLGTPKQEILNFVKEKGIPYHIDATNKETIFLRNKIRHELIPLLKTYNPNVQETLALTAEHLATENILLEKLALRLLKVAWKGNRASFLLSAWEKLSPQEQTHCLRSLFIKKNLYPPSQALVSNFSSYLKNSSHKEFIHTFPRLRVERKNDRIHVHFNEL
jgi:tRNA(Ile)-lysidine synthase